MHLSIVNNGLLGKIVPPPFKTLYPDLIYTNIYAKVMRIQIRIGCVAIQWELHVFRIQFG